MWKKIRSMKILKEIFKPIDDSKKLNIVKYNKKIQNNLGIKFSLYKIYSKKYIVVETDGKIKEYSRSNDDLLFEGEYLNGKRNGKGKEYYESDKIIFEGEYKNGKRNGKGKIYYNNGELKFEGEFNEGKIWNGKGYDKNKN